MSIEAAIPASMVVHSVEDADALMVTVQTAAAQVHDWMTETAKIGNPMAMLRRMKFEEVGFHPIGGHKLNLIEQVNQTWTYAVAIAGAMLEFG